MSANWRHYSSGKPQRKEPARKATGDTFLIVVEGKETEPRYLEAVRGRLKRRAAMVVVHHGAHTDPVGIVQEAIKLRDTQKAKAGKGPIEPYDQVWVVFDRENHMHPRRNQVPAAMQLANASCIRVAHSIPSFEFWLLLHFDFTTSSFNDCAAVVKKLKKFIKDYSKAALPLDDLLDRLPIAMKHAAQCHKHWENAQGDRNPSSHVDELLRELNESAQAEVRLFEK